MVATLLSIFGGFYAPLASQEMRGTLIRVVGEPPPQWECAAESVGSANHARKDRSRQLSLAVVNSPSQNLSSLSEPNWGKKIPGRSVFTEGRYAAATHRRLRSPHA